jgi:hypothetical protein
MRQTAFFLTTAKNGEIRRRLAGQSRCAMMAARDDLSVNVSQYVQPRISTVGPNWVAIRWKEEK